MDPIDIRRSVAAQMASHYVANYQEIGPKSVKELAAHYGVSEETARRASREADNRFATMGLTLTVAEGRNAWRFAPTSDESEFARSTRGRLSAMGNELMRYVAKAEQCAKRDERFTRAFGDCRVAIELAVEALAI